MSSPTLPNKPKKELSNELRMVIAFGLMGLILIGTPYLYRKLGYISSEPPKSTAVKSDVKSEKAQPLPSSAPAPETASETPGAAAPDAVAGTAESEWTLDTNLYRIVFSNKGAVVKSWMLKNFRDSDNRPLELVNQKGAAKVGFPFSYEFRGQQSSAKLNEVPWAAKPNGDGTSISYQYSDSKITASKTFAFQRDGYMMQFADEVRLAGAGVPHLVQWRGGFGDMAVNNAADHQASIHYDAEKKKLVSEAAKSAKNGPMRVDGYFSFAGIEDQYFTAAFLPPSGATTQTTTYDDTVSSNLDGAEHAYPGVAVGGEWRNQLGVYVGPKELNALHAVNPKLEDIIDWGWFGFIAKPLFLILQWMNNGFVRNYGWSIILLTIAINIALFPLKLANLKSMRKMQQLQPELNRINEKYKGISMSDPKSAQKQQETMDLYKKHGVNPMGGCLPMLIQMPFLLAFYKVLSVAIEMRHATWMWVGDLSQPEHFAIRFLPIIMVAASLLMQKMTPMAGGDPNQQKMMQFMPLMYGVFFWGASSGLVLYWLTGNLVGIAQQWFFNKTAAPVVVMPGPAGAKQISPKDGRKRA